MSHDIRRTLDEIHMAACYGTKQNPDSAADSLLLIRDLARRAIMAIDSTHTTMELRTEADASDALELLRVIRLDPWVPNYAIKRIDALLAAMAEGAR